MEIRLIDRKLEDTYQEILRRIRRLQSGGTIDSMLEVGADVSRQIGASYVSLKQLASRYGKDADLALMLWNTGRREEQIVACMLIPDDINTEKITHLSLHALNLETAGYLGSLFLCHYPGLPALAGPWLDSGVPAQEIAILTAMARHLIINKENSLISEEFFRKALDKEYADEYVRRAAERFRFNL